LAYDRTDTALDFTAQDIISQLLEASLQPSQLG